GYQFSGVVTGLLNDSPNPGGATWLQPTSYATGASPAGFAVADFNGDFLPDLAAAEPNASTVRVLWSNGDGGFPDRLDVPAGTSPVALAAGDFNGDRLIDLAVTNSQSNAISVLLSAPGNPLANQRL